MRSSYLIVGIIFAYLSAIHGDFDPRLTRDIVIDTNHRLKVCCSTLDAYVCDPILITQADIDTTGFTITGSGVYFLSEDITFAPTSSGLSAITIDSDNVQLDLRCFSIEQTNTTIGTNGIHLKSHGFLTPVNTSIRNGRLINFTGDGLHVDPNAFIIYGDNIQTFQCTGGFIFDGALTGIQGVFLNNCDVILSNTGYSFNTVGGAEITNCAAKAIKFVGFDLQQCFQMKFVNNYILAVANTTGIGSAYGFKIGGTRNTFFKNYIDTISTIGTSTADEAVAFAIAANSAEITLESNFVTNLGVNVVGQAAGILMNYTPPALNGLQSFFNGDIIRSVNWLSNGRYVALGGDPGALGGFEVRVLEFKSTVPLLLVSNFSHGQAINSVSWSPDGKYLAIGGATSGGVEVRVLQFNGASLTEIATFTRGAEVFSVDWSPSGRFIALGGDTPGAGEEVQVLEFTGSQLSLIASFTHGAEVFSVDWSPDSRFIALGGDANGGSVEVEVIEFNGSTLSSVATFTHGAGIVSVNWSVDEQFVAIGGAANGGGVEVEVLSFGGSSLSSVATFTHGATILSVNWSPDRNYLSIAGVTNGSAVQAQALKFDGTSLVSVATFVYGATLFSINWAPNGAQLVVGGDTSSSINLNIISGFSFSRDCIISKNQITKVNGPFVVGPGVSTGRGIVASSDQNLITKNTAFDNNINFIFSNNVFQQYLVNVQNTVPSLIDNLSFPPL